MSYCTMSCTCACMHVHVQCRENSCACTQASRRPACINAWLRVRVIDGPRLRRSAPLPRVHGTGQYAQSETSSAARGDQHGQPAVIYSESSRELCASASVKQVSSFLVSARHFFLQEVTCCACVGKKRQLTEGQCVGACVSLCRPLISADRKLLRVRWRTNVS